MARSATNDPLDKFRFKVTVISLDLSLTAGLETIAGLAGNNALAVLSRAGFSSATLPKATVKEILYRENIDNQRFIKVPGLATFDPVTLRRGSTENRDFYDWYRLVNEEMALLAVAGELAKDVKFTPAQSNTFRKDVIIEVLDRTGTSKKGWYLFNAWPSAYTPGDDVNAASEEKLIEEITLSYEFFLELEGGVDGFAKEIIKGELITAVSAAAHFKVDGFLKS